MERPECPLCKTKHFAREPHVFGKISADPVVKVKPSSKIEARVANFKCPTCGKFNRNEYQKEYMRKRRAKNAD